MHLVMDAGRALTIGNFSCARPVPSMLWVYHQNHNVLSAIDNREDGSVSFVPSCLLSTNVTARIRRNMALMDSLKDGDATLCRVGLEVAGCSQVLTD
jgi:hypothetical protein